QTVPGNHKIAGVVHADGNIALIALRGCIKAELAPQCTSIRVVPLRENVALTAVLVVSRPGHHVVTGGIHGDSWSVLQARRVGVDSRFASNTTCGDGDGHCSGGRIGIHSTVRSPTVILYLEREAGIG